MTRHEPVNHYGIPGPDAGVFREIMTGEFCARCRCGWAVHRKRQHAAKRQLREHLTTASLAARDDRARD